MVAKDGYRDASHRDRGCVQVQECRAGCAPSPPPMGASHMHHRPQPQAHGPMVYGYSTQVPRPTVVGTGARLQGTHTGIGAWGHGGYMGKGPWGSTVGGKLNVGRLPQILMVPWPIIRGCLLWPCDHGDGCLSLLLVGLWLASLGLIVEG